MKSPMTGAGVRTSRAATRRTAGASTAWRSCCSPAPWNISIATTTRRLRRRNPTRPNPLPRSKTWRPRRFVKQQPPYVCPEPRYWIKGSRRTVNKAEKDIIDGLHQEAEAKCKAAYDTLPPEVWGHLVLLPRNQKVAGKDDVVSLRNPYLNVAGRLMLLRSKRQPKDICSEFFVLGDRTLCKATVKVGQCSATGTAEVIEGTSGPTATNPYEVAETSAVGRALGNLGIGLVGGIASAEEVMNARARSAPLEGEQAA